MKFPVWARVKAEQRQDRYDGFGIVCAKCCTNIDPLPSYAITHIPIAKGGTRKADNCVILCRKCYLEIGEDHTEIIPLNKLPCFEVPKERR